MGIVKSVEEFFGKKPAMDQTQQGQPVMVTEEVPEAPQAPASAPQDVPQGEAQAKPVEDRSAFNCAPCKGEGLLENGDLCPNCNGYGKHLANRSEYPEGTIVVKPEGTFVVTNGEEVRQEAQA